MASFLWGNTTVRSAFGWCTWERGQGGRKTNMFVGTQNALGKALGPIRHKLLKESKGQFLTRKIYHNKEAQGQIREDARPAHPGLSLHVRQHILQKKRQKTLSVEPLIPSIPKLRASANTYMPKGHRHKEEAEENCVLDLLRYRYPK